MTLEPTHEAAASLPGEVVGFHHRSAQTAAAIATRTLLSLGLIALSAAAFRLSLRPISDTAPVPGSQVRQQGAPLAGATSTVVSLQSTWANLTVDSASLPGQAMVGRITLPDTDRVILTAARQGETLKSAYAVHSSSTGYSEPFRIGWNGNGLQFNSAGSNRLGLWTVQIGREVPSDLRLSSTSGDMHLKLANVKLKGLDLSTRSGDVQLDLPGIVSNQLQPRPAQTGPGNVNIRSLSGDLDVTSGRADGRPAAQGAAAASTFKSHSESGGQQLDLSGTAYTNVAVGSATGDLDLTTPGVPELVATVTTLSGNQTVTVPSQVKRGSLNLSSTVGDIRLWVPAGTAVRVTVSARIGDVSAPEGYTRQGDTYLSPAAKTSDSPLDITASTLSGDVTIGEASK